MKQIPSLFFSLLMAISLQACQDRLTNGPAQRNGVSVQRDLSVSARVDGEADVIWLFRQPSAPEQSQGLVLTEDGMKLAPGQSQGQWVSQPILAGFEFDALMPAWKSTGKVEIQLRVGDGRKWGSWLPLFVERSMLLSEKANYLQFRIQMEGGKDSSSVQGLNVQLGHQHLLKKPLQRQPHSIPKPVVVSRQGWNAVQPTGEYTPHTPVGIVIHHTWLPRQAQYQQGASIRGIQRFHMEDNKWMDIGYHFLIGPEGVIYQGRPETVIGAHSVPNTGMIGICVFGDYDPGQDPFTDASRESLLNLLTWLTAEYGIQTSEFYGHRDFSTKSCPGDEIYKHLQEFKDEVQRRLQAAGLLPK